MHTRTRTHHLRQSLLVTLGYRHGGRMQRRVRVEQRVVKPREHSSAAAPLHPEFERTPKETPVKSPSAKGAKIERGKNAGRAPVLGGERSRGKHGSAEMRSHAAA